MRDACGRRTWHRRRGAGMSGMPHPAVSSTGRRSGARPPIGSGCPARTPSSAPARATEPARRRPADGRADPAHRRGGKAAGCAGGQPAAGADPVERRAAAAPALRAEPRHEPGPDPLSAGRRGGARQDDRGRPDPARAEAARHGEADPRRRAQGAGAAMAGRDAAAFRRDSSSSSSRPSCPPSASGAATRKTSGGCTIR